MIELEFPFNIRPLDQSGTIRHLLIDNITRDDNPVDAFVIVPVNFRQESQDPGSSISTDAIVTEEKAIQIIPADNPTQRIEGCATTVSINLAMAPDADALLLLVIINSNLNTEALTELPESTLLDAGLGDCLKHPDWQRFAVPVDNQSRDSHESYAIVFSSCQYPGDLFRKAPPEKSLVRAKHILKSSDYHHCAPYLLIAGDGVYVDPTAGLFEPVSELEKFKAAYDYQAAFNEWQDLLIDMRSTRFAIDDHELIDNWEPSEDPDEQRILQQKLEDGKRWFLQQRLGEQTSGKLWDNRPIGEIPLFVMDTRTERTLRRIDNHQRATMIDDEQCNALENWLLQAEEEIPKLILSPAMILPRRLSTAEFHDLEPINNSLLPDDATAISLSSDSWDGYPQTTGRLLAFIAENQISNVIFLSGDEHLSCIATAELTAGDKDPVTIHSIHASPLYGPYPFANAHVADFAERETFKQHYYIDDKRYHVEVDVATEFAHAGDAFGVLKISKIDKQWEASIQISGDRNSILRKLTWRR